MRLDDINLQVASASKMKDWTLSDWANAWKNPIPKSIVDEAGIEITLSVDEIESIKAQLAMKNFKELLDLEEFNNLIKTNSDNFSQISNDLTLNTQSFEFSFTLDDFAKSFGDTYGLDINNYSDNDNSSLNEGKRRSRKLDIIKRMIRGYRKKKRAEKIEKLMNDEDHWKGLQ